MRVAAAGKDSVPGVRGYGARIMTAATIIRPRRRAFPGSGEQVARVRLFVGQVPAVCAGGMAEESGYGLGLVELIAQCWGYRGGQRGRIVWFMLEWKPNP